MCPTPAPADRHWDGSPHRTGRPRPLRIAPTSPSRLLRTGQSGRCRHCAQRIDLYPRTDRRPVALHPAEVASAQVPEAGRWHFSGGIAHPHGDGSNWCRIPHTLVCPAHHTTCPLSPPLAAIRRCLAVRTRRLIDTGAFTPAPPAATHRTSPDAPAPATGPVVRILLVRYLASDQLESLRCVAQTRHRHRCPHPLLTTSRPAGRWTLQPTGPQRGQLTLPDLLMAVYDLTHLPYTEQLRWRAQRCPAHAAAPGAADLALTSWQPFDPLLHAAHIRTHLPASPTHRQKEQ
ncbi:DUF6083 domain-containing protein [Streptomyces griseoviridis]|uniref:DUF6083 domain-containing protein n=1 Tax=Streptomyces griseoviridis TaxID=45398 RepID=UPI0034410B88